MDVFSHAIAGACTGAVVGRPLLGAALAVLPDVAAVGPRRLHPGALYNLTHSLLFLALVPALASLWGFGGLAYFCIVSHLILDMPTHGDDWAPTLMWPSKFRYSIGHDEWEWFNETWWFGLLLTFLWSASCLILMFVLR